MYAIIEDGGKQYRVEKGDTIYVEERKLPDAAKEVIFDRVLMIGDGAKSRIGAPTVDGAKVTAKLDAALRGPKVDIVKFRRRKHYRRKTGHRQDYLKVTISAISG